jgi:hypothetical protein
LAQEELATCLKISLPSAVAVARAGLAMQHVVPRALLQGNTFQPVLHAVPFDTFQPVLHAEPFDTPRAAGTLPEAVSLPPANNLSVLAVVVYFKLRTP